MAERLDDEIQSCVNELASAIKCIYTHILHIYV